MTAPVPEPTSTIGPATGVVTDPTMLWFGVPWSDALAAVGTVGALLIAVLGVVYEMQRGRLGRLEQRAVAEREQASHVSAWVAIRTHYAEQGYDDIPLWSVIDVCVLNTSPQPVYDVTVSYTWPRGNGEPMQYTRGLVSPASAHEVLAHESTDMNDDVEAEGVTPLRLTFRDGAGRWWRRDTTGTLERLPTDPSLRVEG